MSLDINLEPLSVEDLEGQPVATTETIHVPIVPVPDEALPLVYRHPTLGAPVETWPYMTNDGSLVGFMAVWIDDDGNVERRPLTFCRSSGSTGWRAEGFPAPYPLFNASALGSNAQVPLAPLAPVVIVNDERQAKAAQVFLPSHIGVCSPYELGLMAKTDWSALQGRDVIVCPAAGELAGQFATLGAECAYRAGADTVRVLMLDTIGQIVLTPGGLSKRPATPEGWGLEQAIRDGWTPEAFAKQVGPLDALPLAPKPLVFDSSGNVSFRRTGTGIEALHVTRTDRIWINIFGPLEIVALSRTADGDGWGKRFRLVNHESQEVFIDLPAKDLAGDGTPIREALLDLGLQIGTTKFQRDKLIEYIGLATSSVRLRDAGMAGWHDNVFVTGHAVIGTHTTGETVRYTKGRTSPALATRGSLDGWRNSIADKALGNSRLVFAISAAFAAPLLRLTGAESGAFHFTGGSSIGKTTLLHVAGSVWGGGGMSGYVRSFNMTDNAAEGFLEAHNDCLVCLEEIGQATSKVMDSLSYMLANGIGKGRMARTLVSRKPATWRVLVLATGEVSLDAKIAEQGHKRAAAGQQVRFVDLDADAGAGLGMFETLHGASSPAQFAQALKQSAQANYGHAAIAFIEQLQSDMEGMTQQALALEKLFLQQIVLPKGADGQVHRVAARFATIAAAGELAIRCGIVSWPQGQAMAATVRMFNDWIAKRGGFGSLEDDRILEQLRYYLSKTAGFMRSTSDDDEITASTGFIKTFVKEGKCYCMPPEVWRRDACLGIDQDQAASLLAKRGFLAFDAGRLQKQLRFGTKRKWVYAIKDTLMAEPFNAGETKSVSLEEFMPEIP